MPTAKKGNYTPKQQVVDFGTAIARFWTKYAIFNGTAQRSEFWFTVLFNFLVTLPIWLITDISYEVGTFFDFLWILATFIPWMALWTRRFHDAGFSAKWWWVPLVSAIGGFAFSGMIALIAETTYNDAAMAMAGVLAGMIAITLIGFGIFWFVVTLLPSKFEDNPFRK